MEFNVKVLISCGRGDQVLLLPGWCQVDGSSLEKLHMTLVSNANSVISDGFNLAAFDACDLIGSGVKWWLGSLFTLLNQDFIT